MYGVEQALQRELTVQVSYLVYIETSDIHFQEQLQHRQDVVER